MKPRKVRAWVGRFLLSTGIVLTVFLSAPGLAHAADAGEDSSAAVVAQYDPTWG